MPVLCALLLGDHPRDTAADHPRLREIVRPAVDGRVERSHVLGQPRLVELGAAVGHHGDDRDPQAPTLVAQHVEKSGRVVHLVFGQVEIGGIVERHEQHADARHPHATGCEI